MSQENVNALRDSLDAFDRRDRATWLAFRAPDCLVVPSLTWPEAHTVRGRVAAWDFYVKVVEAFERDSVSDAEVVDAGADTVLVHQHNDMRGRASGAKVEIDYWIVVTFRDGKIVRDEWFANRAEALEALGPREQSMSQANVEVVRAVLDAFSAGDVDAMLALLTDDVDLRPPSHLLDGIVFRGHAAPARGWRGRGRPGYGSRFRRIWWRPQANTL